MMQRYGKGGWYGQSHRHYLAAKGIKTSYDALKIRFVDEPDEQVKVHIPFPSKERREAIIKDFSGSKEELSPFEERMLGKVPEFTETEKKAFKGYRNLENTASLRLQEAHIPEKIAAAKEAAEKSYKNVESDYIAKMQSEADYQHALQLSKDKELQKQEELRLKDLALEAAAIENPAERQAKLQRIGWEGRKLEEESDRLTAEENELKSIINYDDSEALAARQKYVEGRVKLISR